MAVTKKPATGPWLMWFGAMVVFSTVATSLYCWGAAKPMLAPLLGTLAATLFVFVPVALLASTRFARRLMVDTKTVADPPEPLWTLLKQELDASRLGRVVLSYGADGSASTFPRPMAMGKGMSISKRICEEWTTEALVWSSRTDAAAELRFIRRLRIVFVLAVPTFYLLGLSERLSSGHLLLIGIVVVLLLLFLGAGIYGYRLQVAADREFTVTERDRQAAKEALSYPYFMQKDRSTSQKWLFFSAELRGRARHLGIELERGYRVPDSAEQA